jgi:TRAP-type mannitol/chloroaromatic compound transport system permease small subunit
MSVLIRSLRWFSAKADAIVDAVGRGCAWIVLFVIGALFAQWPLREWLGGGHILANDFGQIAHAAVFSLGIAYAMRWDGHVRLDLFYQRLTQRGKAIIDLTGSALIVVPWAGMVMWYSVPTALRSVAGFEQFPETWTPGYWVFKALLVAFTSLLLLQTAGHIARDIAALLAPERDAGADGPPRGTRPLGGGGAQRRFGGTVGADGPPRGTRPLGGGGAQRRFGGKR